jgi:hypothetical protein
LLGEFVRVPERLITKIFQTNSLSRSWRFDIRSWLAATHSAAGAVSRARLRGRERFVLYAELTAFAAATVGSAVWRRTRKTVRALVRAAQPQRS